MPQASRGLNEFNIAAAPGAAALAQCCNTMLACHSSPAVEWHAGGTEWGGASQLCSAMWRSAADSCMPCMQATAVDFSLCSAGASGARARTVVAGAIIASVANFLKLICLGLHNEKEAYQRSIGGPTSFLHRGGGNM